MLRRPIFFILGIVLLLIAFGWIIFTIPWGGNDSTVPISEEKKLVDYADTDVKVRMIQNGAIVNSQNHREVWITVGREEIIGQVKRGYQGTTIRSERDSNNVAAYSTFLAALDGRGFGDTRVYRGDQTEEGACPFGIRYIFDMYNSDETILHSWATSCSVRIGTFDGRLSDVTRLFQRQMPDYNDFTDNVDLRP